MHQWSFDSECGRPRIPPPREDNDKYPRSLPLRLRSTSGAVGLAVFMASWLDVTPSDGDKMLMAIATQAEFVTRGLGDRESKSL